MWHDRKLKAETAEELEQIRTPNGIRQRLLEASRYDPLVRRVFDLAVREGLSGEDIYTLLAYHAIVQKQELEQLILDDLNTRVMPALIISGAK